jgi:hypothetical protein
MLLLLSLTMASHCNERDHIIVDLLLFLLLESATQMLYAANGAVGRAGGWSLSELSVDGVLMSRLEQRKPMVLGLASDRELPAGPALISAAAGC